MSLFSWDGTFSEINLEKKIKKKTYSKWPVCSFYGNRTQENSQFQFFANKAIETVSERAHSRTILIYK